MGHELIAREPRFVAEGSCGRCFAALDLVSVNVRGVWYCSSACADGESRGERERAVSESWLYPAPRRFFRKRRPTELR